MNFEQLSYIKKIYETESIIYAAKAMHISQSAMSQSIANLETELGCKLFNRSRKGTLPTQDGKHLIPYIIEILEAQHNLLDKVDAMKAQIDGSLTIATIPTLFNKVVPKALSKFNKDYPHINVKIFESDKDEIIRLLQKNDVDIGLIGIRDNETVNQDLQLHALNRSSGFKLIVPKKSKLALKEEVNLEAIQQYPFVLYDRSFYQNNLKVFEEENGPLKIVFRTNNPSVLIRTVSEGLGISIVSNLIIEDDPFIMNGTIETVPIGKPFDYYIYFTALTKLKDNNNAAMNKFISYLRN